MFSSKRNENVEILLQGFHQREIKMYKTWMAEHWKNLMLSSGYIIVKTFNIQWALYWYNLVQAQVITTVI